MPFTLSDAAVNQSVALAASTSTPRYSMPIATGQTGRGDFAAQVEFEVALPALSVGQLPNGATSTVELQTDDNVSFTSPTTLASWTQTGAGGAGAAALTRRLGLPSSAEGYVRLKASSASGANDLSAASATLTFCN